MSAEPVNLAEDGQDPLYADWYAGPRRTDGFSNRRLQLTRGESMIQLSMPEVFRLISMLVQRPR